MPAKWFIYILQCADGTYYTGCTTNIESRLEKHNKGKGARYTCGRLPVTLVYSEPAASRSEAAKREHQIKQWPRSKKHKLIKGSIEYKMNIENPSF